MRQIWIVLAALLIYMDSATSQSISVKGVVMEQKVDGSLRPMEFVNVFWMKSTRNTMTDSTGYFFIAHGPDDGDHLIFRFLGYDPDTVKVKPGQYISVVFKEQSSQLGEVVVAHRKRATEISFLNPLQVQNISSDELFKAACCNLSESFTTNATVDVSFTDAITGAKEIQMLGLSGKYSLISQEQMPGVRGIAIPYGMLYTPGPWIESIQISKGSGSVLQGYESMTGQINVELKKPISDEKLHINGFFSEAYRSELNVFTRMDVNKKLKTALMGHVSLYPEQHDRNEDTFMDMPTGSLLTLANRWNYRSLNSGMEGQLLVQYTRDRKEAGITSHGSGDHQSAYNVGIDGDRIQANAKVGYLFPEKRYNSIGTQWSFTRHTQTANIGHHLYEAAQTSFYGNWIYQSIISDTRHQYLTGLSFRYDEYDETLDQQPFAFEEAVPGAFFEYTYKPDELFTLVAGIRADKHNLYGWLINPRLHLRYAPDESMVFRLSGGRGMRTPLPVAEHLGWLASSRTWRIGQPDDSSKLPYNGLRMEKAWNAGASITKEFTMDYRSGILSVDFFHTRFTDRAVADLDLSPQQLWIYNLDGTSFAHTFQAELQYELLKRLDAKVAYKWQDTRIEYRELGERQQIFTPRSRFFANLSYVSSLATYKGHWRISLTAHHTGEQRIPDTDTNPLSFQLPSLSPGYWLYNGQLTRVFNKKFELYFGIENIGNFKQSPVILDALHPQSPYFDSGLIWGPIFGREWYTGFRYMLH